MRMKTKQTVCITLFASLVLWSCNEDNAETPRSQNNELPENAIGFSVLQNIGDELPTKADVTADNLSPMTVYAYYTGTTDFDGFSTPNLMSGVTVTKNSNGWTYSPLKYWPAADHKVSFFAIASEPEPVLGNGIALQTSTGYPIFSVTPPESPAEQKDLVVASAVNQIKGSGDGTVALTFNHVMTKVSFAASYTGVKPFSGWIKVKELKLKNVASGGMLTFAPSGASSWSEVSTTLADYTLSTANNDLNDIKLTTSSTNISATDRTLKLVPQTPTSAQVVLTATLSDATTIPEEKDYELTASPTTTAWLPGKHITYSFEIDVTGKFNLTQWNFTYTGAVQTFTVPVTGTYKFEAWGAKGGNSLKDQGQEASGGNGGYTKGQINLTAGQIVYIYVGEAGSGGTVNPGDYIIPATFNGGGRGGVDYAGSGWGWGSGGWGGGATDFRLVAGDWNNATSLNSRIMVAGGGGGGEMGDS